MNGMNDIAKSFTCSSCGEELPARALAIECVEEASALTGKRQPRARALLLVEEPICSACADTEGAEVEELSGWPTLGRNDIESFEFSGLHIDPARRQAHLLNY